MRGVGSRELLRHSGSSIRQESFSLFGLAAFYARSTRTLYFDSAASDRAPRQVLEAYMSPGSVTERLHFFVAEYEDRDRVSAGGGEADEGEEIETIELALDEAMRMIDSGAIQDGKTIMLLQYVQRVGWENLRPATL
jgi:hypothetical protein